MHRIDADGHSENQFVDENIDEGQEATVLDAAWANAVQEEISNTIELSGLTLTKGDNTQLFDAIMAIVGNAGAMLLEGRFLHTTAFDNTKWRECNGATLNRTDWPQAWAAIQASGLLAADGADKNANPGKFGRGDDATTFELPDLRDQFLRVYKGAKAGAIGPALGGFKANQNKEHTHTINVGVAVSNSSTSGNAGDNMVAGATGASGGNEANPDHTSLIYVIRLK